MLAELKQTYSTKRNCICIACIDLGENWRNLNFIVQNVFLIWEGIVLTVLFVRLMTEQNEVRIQYKVDESVWMPIYNKIHNVN